MTSRQAEARRRLDTALELLVRGRKPIDDARLEQELGRQPIALDQVRKKISEQIAGVRTSNPEGAGSGDGPAAWCWDDQQEVTRCHADGKDCTGDPVSGPSDPAGEAAVNASRDQAAADDRELHACLGRILKETTTFGEILARYLDVEHHQGEKGCDLCSIVRDEDDDNRPVWSPVRTKGNSLDGLLGQGNDGQPIRKSTCLWHERFVAKAGRLPTRDEVKRHGRGERVDAPKAGAR